MLLCMFQRLPSAVYVTMCVVFRVEPRIWKDCREAARSETQQARCISNIGSHLVASPQTTDLFQRVRQYRTRRTGFDPVHSGYGSEAIPLRGGRGPRFLDLRRNASRSKGRVPVTRHTGSIVMEALMATSHHGLPRANSARPKAENGPTASLHFM
jgi:hypothetical protein